MNFELAGASDDDLERISELESEQWIDQGGDCRAAQCYQRGNQAHSNKNRDQPPFLVFTQELDEFLHDT